MGKGNLGTSAQPIKLYSERVVLTPRTGDPSSPSAGEVWFREDLDSGTDKLGEVRWYDGSSTNSVPVFDTGTSGADVEEVLRLQTPNGLGFIPVTGSGGSYSQLRFQHANSTLEWHDAQSVIPDSVVTQYQAEDEADTTTTIDSIGNNDASLTGTSYTTTAKVGSHALLHDGTDDETTSNSTNDLAAGGAVDGYGFAAWINIQSNGGLSYNYALDVSNDNNNRSSLIEDGSGGIDFDVQVNGQTAANTTKFSSSTSTWYHATCNFYADGTIELIIHNASGSQVFSDSANTSLDPANIGAMTYAAGYSAPFNGNYLNVIVDDYALANEPLSEDDIDGLVGRGT